MDLAAFALAAVGMFAGGVAAGAVGFGLVLVAAPVLAVATPTLVPFVFSLPALGANAWVARRERAALDVALLRRLLVWQVPGALLGAWVLGRLDERTLGLAVGLLVLLLVGFRLTPWRPPRTPAWERGSAVVAGAAGAIAGVNGPPLAALLADEPPALIRATLPAFFTVANLVLIASWTVTGTIRWPALAAGLLLLPATLLGSAVGQRLSGRLQDRTVRQVVLVLALGAVAAALAG